MQGTILEHDKMYFVHSSFFFNAAIVISSNGHFLKIILGLWRFRISSFKSIALKYSCGVFLPCGTLKPRRMPTLVLQVC